MVSREKTKSSMGGGGLNSLNEEEESSSFTQRLDDSFIIDNNNRKETTDQFSSASSNQRNEDQHKLRLTIEGIFKPIVGVCETDTNLDENKKRAESLKHILIERLVTTTTSITSSIQDLNFYNNNKQNKNRQVNKSKYNSPAIYSDYLTITFSTKQQDQPTIIIPEQDEAYLDLTNLSLNNECLKDFRIDDHNDDDPIIDLVELKKNSELIKNINLSQNRMSALPVSLLNMFNNLEKIDISENNFDGFLLANLSLFNNLKEVNLSNNLLKSIKLEDDENNNNQELDLYNKLEKNELNTQVLFSVERLNLANNKLNCNTSLVVAEFHNLKYLNLSNNEFVLNSTLIEFQLPWQRPNSNLKSLIELNFSKNNKQAAATVANHQQSLSMSVRHKTPRPDTKSAASASNKIINLPYFDTLINLRVLDLSENNLRNMPNDIKELRNLETLILDFNFLEFLPMELTELRRLKTLSASSNRISELSMSFCSFARFRDTITSINLSKNQLKEDSFTYKIAIFENLKELDLSHNLFELVPNPMPPNIEILNLNNNKIKTLMIRPLSQLAINDDDVMTVLDLEDRKFRPKKVTSPKVYDADPEQLEDENDEPEETESMKEEKFKRINNNNDNRKKKFGFDERIYDEPDIDKMNTIEIPHVFYLRSLKRLRLRDNHLSEIPLDFGILNSNLEFLDLGLNLLTEINVSLCRGLTSLKYLDLSSNRIKKLPEKLRELNELEYLDLSKNRIDLLSSEICNDLKNLKELDLSGNSLVNLLVTLNLPSQKSSLASTHSRQASTVSSDLTHKQQYAKFSFNLPNLKKLNLSNNKLSDDLSLYRSFALSSQLIEIDLSSNQLTSIEVDNIEEKESISMAFNEECIFDEEKIKRLSVPKHRLFELKQLNFSHNNIQIECKGGFTKLLCNLYKLAPKLSKFIYDQKKGTKLSTFYAESIIQTTKPSIPESLIQLPTGVATENTDDYCFELSDEDYFIINLNEEIKEKNELLDLLNSKIRKEFYELLNLNLESIDLSNNSLRKIPSFIYRLKNLKEIYFNGNLLQKIPAEMFKHPQTIDPNEEEEFENLKKIQQKTLMLKKKASEDKENDADDDEKEREKEDDELVHEIKIRKKRKKQNQDNPPQIEPLIVNEKHNELSTVKDHHLVADQLEILQLNNNKIEHVPNNLFDRFKMLRELKLNENPLANPPQHSVCVSAKLTRNQEFLKQQQQLKTNIKTFQDINNSRILSVLPSTMKTSNFMRESLEAKTLEQNRRSASITQFDKKMNLPNLFFETTENLKPLQSYMSNHKKREDNIDSLQTLMKLLRRLKMPIDRCEYVCTEIRESVAKNWTKIASIEYPPEPGKLSMSRKESLKKMNQYILKLQAWNMLNAWRNTNGADAHSDELLRILKLMNSNNYENDLYEKLFKLKFKSNAFRV